mmetsp:Transcript_3645/g.5162  ORF Transcript_3645/g.5162 Transcript_3645/m.5162 type:complete len:88 (+) Transcript_3645:364-627(+)
MARLVLCSLFQSGNSTPPPNSFHAETTATIPSNRIRYFIYFRLSLPIKDFIPDLFFQSFRLKFMANELLRDRGGTRLLAAPSAGPTG